MKRVKLRHICVLLGMALVGFPLFTHLTDLPLRLWDESRLAANALEMIQSGDPIVTRFGGSPEMWSTKPPLMIWLQVICIKLLGYNELAIRLPSALAAFLTALLLWWYGAIRLKQPVLGFAAALILVSFPGFVQIHSSRTGDYDALLTLCMLSSLLALLLYKETQNARWILMAAIATTLAVLTKGVAGLLFLPAMAVFVMWHKSLWRLFSARHTGYGICFFLFFVVGYYVLREQMNPSFWAAVVENELSGRYQKALEGHKGAPNYYLKYLSYYGQISWWFGLLPVATLVGLWHSNPTVRASVGLMALAASLHLAILSFAQTKLYWYMMPIFPCFAWILAVLVSVLGQNLVAAREGQPKTKSWLQAAIPYVLVLVMAIIPYCKVINGTLFYEELPEEKERVSVLYTLKNAISQNKDMSRYCLVARGYHPDIRFYLHQLSNKGQPLCVRLPEQLKAGDIAFTNVPRTKKFVEANYNYKVSTVDLLTFYEILGPK